MRATNWIAAFFCASMLSLPVADARPIFQAKCHAKCAWLGPERDKLDVAIKDGKAHQKENKGHAWDIVRHNKK